MAAQRTTCPCLGETRAKKVPDHRLSWMLQYFVRCLRMDMYGFTLPIWVTGNPKLRTPSKYYSMLAAASISG
jgi:hypothetical protein